MQLYSYVLRLDDGAAPNPYCGVCTLTICKPQIRKNAREGDWVIGTGSKRTLLQNGDVKDYSNHAVYVMRITSKKTLQNYNTYCRKHLKGKIPNWLNGKSFESKVGDCLYHGFKSSKRAKQRIGVHDSRNKRTDLSGLNSLLSTHFYYFGNKPKRVPFTLRKIIKRNQGHKKIENKKLIIKFESWISKFPRKERHGEPLHKYLFERSQEGYRKKCASSHSKEHNRTHEVCEK